MKDVVSTKLEYILNLRNGNTPYRYHHTSTLRGYISRKVTGEVRPYKGKFGEGFTIDIPRFDSTQYHFREYYILPKDKKDFTKR